MKRIMKGREPCEFSKWKRRDKMAKRGRPRWNRVNKKVRKKIHKSLVCEQGFICCYCEARISRADSHVEHFRPQTKFPDLQLEYDNLHCSCQRESLRGEPRHCGHGKASWFDEDCLISPLTRGCEERFKFTANGEILPHQHDDEGAKTTIQRLGLDLPKLRALRAAAIDGLYDLSEGEILQLLNRGEDGRFLAFHTTVKQVLLP